MKKVYMVLSFFILFLSIITVYGNTIYVPDNHPTIQKAIDTAKDGDTIIVRDGIYYENLIINKSITLKSENGPKNCIIDGNNSGSVVVINVDGVTIEGFTIRNSGNSWSDAGIEVNSHNNKIKDNYITNNSKGIYLFLSNNNIITGNIIKENGMGILLSDSSYNSIINNTFIRDGITIEGEVWDYWIHTVENNTVNGKPLYYIRDKVGGSIREDTGQVILVNCRDMVIEDVNISDTDRGVTLVGSFNITVRNCEISNNSGSGVYLWCSDNCIITGNNIRENGNGIYFVVSSNNIIIGNNIWENEIGIYLRYSSSNNNIIVGNNITENNEGIYFIDSVGNIIVGNDISENKNKGIYLTSGSSISGINIIMKNNIRDNGVGIYLWHSYANKIYFNNFINNKYNPIYLWDFFFLPIKILVPNPIQVLPLLCLLYITLSLVF